MKRILCLFLLCISGLVAGCSEEDETAAPGPLATQAPGMTAPGDPSAVPSPAAADGAVTGEEAAYSEQRERMVARGIAGMGVTDETVLAAMRAVPRHRFVPAEWLAQAYENHPLPIGYGQTISQPFIVGLMTEAADVETGDRVLEIGTGSGYQAAVLAEIVEHVFTMEIIGPLVERAEATLDELGYDNITVRHADGYYGWEEEAPFDAIVVTAAPDHIPQPLVAQLRTGGHLIIPVGPPGGYQTLWRVTKVSDEEVRTEDLGGVAFVPFTREEPAE
ncbi:MAG: protein-L-isoaspartate(D-aspartate) O-methyltransferase [Anaerolineae bacterium]|nr:protein-L-isoaspartate(D-aspartate) O-methyltransferase [Anaerolineae bacterium]